MIWALALGASVAVGAAAAAPDVHDHLHYLLGGLMSGPTELNLDLATGEFSLGEGTPATGFKVVETRGRLAPSSLAKVKGIAGSALTEGFETEACKRAEAKGVPMLPIMDAMPAMDLKLGDRWVTAPVRIDCWNKVADDLAGAALEAAHNDPATIG